MDEDLAMFTHAQLASLAGVKPERLRYWEKSGLIRSTTSPAMRGPYAVRLYNYTDALTTLVLASLRDVVSLQQVRQIVAHLRERDFDMPEVRFAVVAKRVFFQLPSGEWQDVRDPLQIVIHQTLDLRPLKSRLDRAARRDESLAGQTERRRGARASKPLFAGTRVPVAAVERYLARGATVAEVLAAYPSLTAEDVALVSA